LRVSCLVSPRRSKGGGAGMAAGLDYGDAVEGGVELPVPAPG
jgi:hypothetical protein